MSDSWWEMRIFCDSFQEESIYWRLETWGSRGTATEVKGKNCLIRAYIPEAEAQLSKFKEMDRALRLDAVKLELDPPEILWKIIEEEDWASSWKQYWEPTEIGDRFLIYPGWLSVPKNLERSILLLDPGAAFGTGTHPTTQLCIESLEMRLGFSQTNKDVLVDVGCGSGILSVAALLLGAKHVYSLDVDPLAVSSAAENRGLNSINPEKMTIIEGTLEDLTELKQQKVDGIICNILAEPIVEMIPQFNAIANANTWGVLSGILLDKAKRVADALESNGWIVATLWKRGEWCCLNIRRADKPIAKNQKSI